MTKSELIVKSNKLIEASYRLTLVEQRIILLAITEGRKSKKEFNAMDFIPIRAKEYAEIYNLPFNQAYEQLKEAAKTLFDREFTLYDTCPEAKNGIIKGRWVSAASYFDGTGIIKLQFSGIVIPYITKLEKEFTRYKLEQISNMTSAHAIRLYELLIQWGSIGRREIEIEWLKKALMIDDQYSAIKDFKARVIDVAVAQINKHTDITVSYTQRKTGRVVSHITFAFTQKAASPKRLQTTETPAITTRLDNHAPQPPKPVEVQEGPKTKDTSSDTSSPTVKPRDAVLLQRLRNYGIGEKLAITWLNQNEARTKAALEYTEERAQQGHIKGTIAGYLRKLFESGNEIGGASVEQAIAQQKAEEQAQREHARKERERLAEIEQMKWLSEATGTPLEKLLPKRLFPDVTGTNVRTASSM